MKEILELRMNIDFVNILFRNEEIRKIGSSVGVVELHREDPRYEQIPTIAETIKRKYNKAFFWGWRIRRKYTKKELQKTELFHLRAKNVFEPTGEECGTIYDETMACDICGAHRKQQGLLKLKQGTIPRKDIVQTIGGEVVVSERFVRLTENRMKGLEFLPTNVKSYYQLIPVEEIELSPQTIVGVNPFDFSTSCESEIYKCPQGDTIGLNLLSEAYVCNSPLIEKHDFFMSKQYIGVKRGLLRPEPLYFCSPKFRQMIIDEGLKGFEFEIAHIV